MKFRVTLWFEEDDLVVSFTHPYLGEYLDDHPEIDPASEEFDTTDADSNEANGILEYMGQSDDWSGLFYSHDHVLRIKVEQLA